MNNEINRAEFDRMKSALERIRDATPASTNSSTPAEMASWTYAVAASALDGDNPGSVDLVARADRALKDALFAVHESGRASAEYGGVLVDGNGGRAWVTYEVRREQDKAAASGVTQ